MANATWNVAEPCPAQSAVEPYPTQSVVELLKT